MTVSAGATATGDVAIGAAESVVTEAMVTGTGTATETGATTARA